MGREWFHSELRTLPRRGNFPLKVLFLYSCQDLVIRHYPPLRQPEDEVEISLRLSSQNLLCTDIVNGTPYAVPFPNLALKRPGAVCVLGKDDHAPRSTLSFRYSADVLPLLKEWKFLPLEDCVTFSLTRECQRLLREIHSTIPRLFLPGVADTLDWLCLSLYREAITTSLAPQKPQKNQEKIAQVALHIQEHFNQTIDFQELARENGLSRQTLFREWKKYFSEPPHRYQNSLKLEQARNLLENTTLPITAIIREIHYAGTSAFWNHFTQKFGLSPREVRNKARNNWQSP